MGWFLKSLWITRYKNIVRSAGGIKNEYGGWSESKSLEVLQCLFFTKVTLSFCIDKFYIIIYNKINTNAYYRSEFIGSVNDMFLDELFLHQ